MSDMETYYRHDLHSKTTRDVTCALRFYFHFTNLGRIRTLVVLTALSGTYSKLLTGHSHHTDLDRDKRNNSRSIGSIMVKQQIRWSSYLVEIKGYFLVKSSVVS